MSKGRSAESIEEAMEKVLVLADRARVAKEAAARLASLLERRYRGTHVGGWSEVDRRSLDKARGDALEARERAFLALALTPAAPSSHDELERSVAAWLEGDL